MDSLTHVVLGACAGELIAGREAGKKVLIIGALANSFPDIDFLASFFLPLTSDLLAHRGFTHSFTFIALFSPLSGYLSYIFFKKKILSPLKWTLFWAIQMFIHIVLDAFNAYGTGWFEPFSHYRVSFNSMFVADPLYTIWPALCTILLFLLPARNTQRRIIATIAVSVSTCYLAWGIIAKNSIDSFAHRQLRTMGADNTDYFSTPTPLNNMLWYIVARKDSGYLIGYRSILDDNKPVSFRYVPVNDTLLRAFDQNKDIQNLKRFSNGFYYASVSNDTLLFNDLRFGEILGWQYADARCVFYYYPQYPSANDLIVQRGRFEGWNTNTFRFFVARMMGNR